MDAFYERDKRKKPLAFALTDGTPFTVAGSITVPANDLVGTIHDRTPAIIAVAQRPVGPPDNFCGRRRLLFFVVLFDIAQVDSHSNQE